VPSSAADYLPGSVKVHPEWPVVLITAHRTVFSDDDHTNCTSWTRQQPVGGTGFLFHSQVQDWPDVPSLTRLAPKAAAAEPDPEPVPVAVAPPTTEDLAGVNLTDGMPAADSS
jgi:hypothetical protein